MTQSELPGY